MFYEERNAASTNLLSRFKIGPISRSFYKNPDCEVALQETQIVGYRKLDCGVALQETRSWGGSTGNPPTVGLLYRKPHRGVASHETRSWCRSTGNPIVGSLCRKPDCEFAPQGRKPNRGVATQESRLWGRPSRAEALLYLSWSRSSCPRPSWSLWLLPRSLPTVGRLIASELVASELNGRV